MMGHIPDEVDIKTQLDQSDRKVLTYQSGPSGPIYENGLFGKDEIHKVTEGCWVYGLSRFVDTANQCAQGILVAILHLIPRQWPSWRP